MQERHLRKKVGTFLNCCADIILTPRWSQNNVKNFMEGKLRSVLNKIVLSIQVFSKWKSKIKVKAQEIVCGMAKTGGGGPLPQLNPIEERLMAIIGWRAVTGDDNVEMGVVSFPQKFSLFI